MKSVSPMVVLATVCVPLSMATGYISTHDNTTNNTFRSL